jgi:hypothetical protein
MLMDITAVSAASSVATLESAALAAPVVQRPLMVQISPAAKAELGMMLSNAAREHGASTSSGIAQMVDRLRADFSAMRGRLSQPVETQLTVRANSVNSVNGANSARNAAAPAAQLEAVMNQALRTQTEIFQVAVSFQAGLTASQQSQSGIKTLVEKS